MQTETIQVLADKEDRLNGAVAVGERQSDVEHALRMLVERVHDKNHSPAAMLTAINFMTAAAAVLKAGVKTLGGDTD